MVIIVVVEWDLLMVVSVLSGYGKMIVVVDWVFGFD